MIGRQGPPRISSLVADSPAKTKHSEVAPGQSNWALVRWMIGLGLQHPRRCLAVLGFNLLILALSLSGLSLTGLGVDVLRRAVDPKAPSPRGPLGLTPPPEMDPFWVMTSLAGVIVALALVRAALRYMNTAATSGLIQAVLTNLRGAVYDKMQRLSFRFFDANQTGSLINRAASDATGIATFAEVALVQIVVLIITLSVFLAYMIHLHAWLTLAGIATVPLMAVGTVFFSKQVRPAHEENRRLYDQLLLKLSESIQGQHVVKGFGLQDSEIEKFREANLALRRQQRWLFARTSLFSALIDFASHFNLTVVLFYGGYIVISHRHEPNPPLTPGLLLVFTSLLSQFSGQVLAMTNLANSIQANLTAAGRVKEVLDAPLEIQSVADAKSLPKARGEVKFENVSFAYAAGEPVLNNVSFEVEAGQCLAILGATGAGKSTLLSMIPRFYDPTQGRVVIDGIDARQIRLDDLRRSIGLVFQESFLFSNTVAANIAFGNPGATREMIENAAKIAAAHEFIMDLPQGYDTVVGEYGSSLSGGQRQRLAIARAVLLEPSILILDDATAAIDPETEHEILQAMDNAMKGRTTFVVAHRLSTLRRADKVIVLEQGRVIEAGTHAELIRGEGLYRNVARLQLVDRESQEIMRARAWYEGQSATLLPLKDDQA